MRYDIKWNPLYITSFCSLGYNGTKKQFITIYNHSLSKNSNCLLKLRLGVGHSLALPSVQINLVWRLRIAVGEVEDITP